MDAFEFHKMEGCGNDYVVVRPGAFEAADAPAAARQLCDRRFGVGADGLLWVGPTQGASFSMRMWNPDGSEAEMCGNGLRCAVRFALETGLAKEAATGTAAVRPGTLAWHVHARAYDAWDVEIEVGTPEAVRELDLGAGLPRVVALSIGNPHAVAWVEDVEAVDLAALGPRVEHHVAFPNRTNFEVVSPARGGAWKQRTWERGVGETLACGTGAAAVFVAGRWSRRWAHEVVLQVRGGTLRVRQPNVGDAASGSERAPVYLRGPARLVYVGRWKGEHGDL